MRVRQRSALAVDNKLRCKAIQNFVRQLSAIALHVSFELGVIRTSRARPIAVCIFRTVQTLFAAVSGSRRFALEFARVVWPVYARAWVSVHRNVGSWREGRYKSCQPPRTGSNGREDMLQHSLEIHTSCLKRSTAVSACAKIYFRMSNLRNSRNWGQGKGANKRFG